MSKNIPEWITNLALDIYKIIDRYKAMSRFQEMLNIWAENHQAEIANEIAWNKERASHFEKNVATNDRLQDEQTGPPEDGWQFQGYVQHTDNSHNLIQGWVPPKLVTRPDIKRILPLSDDHELSLAEKYTVFAVIYEYSRKGTEQLPLWECPDLTKQQTPEAMSDAKKCMSFEILSHSVVDLVPEDEGWLRVMLNDVEADVAEWAGGQSPDLKEEQTAKAVSETSYDSIVRWAKDNRWIKYVILGFILLVAIGTAIKNFEIITAAYYKITGQQQKEQIQMARVEDKPIVTATATVEITIRSEEQVNAHHPYQGAVLAFGKDKEALLTLSSKESHAKQMGTSEVRYSSELDMKTTDKAFKQPLSFLQQVEFAQLRFDIIPLNSVVLSGTVVCIFNNNIPIELSVPPQKMREKLIKITEVNIAEILRQHSKNK
jgi:hypothetical protein